MAYLGEDFKKLGFGFMRLPKLKDGTIDLEQTKKMVDLFLERGFTYFDTAYVYDGGGSEIALRKSLIERYPRDSFQIATKLSLMSTKTAGDGPHMFETSMERLGVDYFDFYLLHNVSRVRAETADRFDLWNYARKQKEAGRIRHLGFSFHDTADVLDEVLTKHPEMEFVQLQINYADWENGRIQSRLCYETARKHGKPVIIMEPVKGGALAALPEEAEARFHEADPNASNASWALRFAASLPGLITVLSGMSTLAQVEDNTSFMQNVKPLTADEQELVMKAAEILRKQIAVPCTACRYCVDGCPKQIPIPMVFDLYNDYCTYHQLPRVRNTYGLYAKGDSTASSCIGCGHCEEVCPQHLPIRKYLNEAGKVFDA